MDRMLGSADRKPGLGRHGCGLVVIDEQRVALAVSLILQEMGMAVDMAANRTAALRWAVRAHYAVTVCGGSGRDGGKRDAREQSAGAAALAIEMRRAAPQTRVILLAGAGPTADELHAAGVEVLPAPFDVNRLVERLWPLTA